MNDESRDPEIQALREHWQPPGPAESLDERVRRAYRRNIRSGKRIRRVWLPMLAAMVLAAAAGWMAGARVEHTPRNGPAFVPVRQPQLVVFTQEERP